MEKIDEWSGKGVALGQKGPIPYEELRVLDRQHLPLLDYLTGKEVVIYGEGIRGYFQGLVERIMPIGVVGRACDPASLCVIWNDNGRGVILAAGQKIIVI